MTTLLFSMISITAIAIVAAGVVILTLRLASPFLQRTAEGCALIMPTLFLVALTCAVGLAILTDLGQGVQ